jgi:hypothetical protein
MEAVIDPADIHGIEAVEVLWGGREHITDVGNARVVDEDIKTPQSRKRSADGFCVRDIGGEYGRYSTRLPDKTRRFLPRLGTEFQDRDGRSFGG